jgi:hypothetical protein
MSAATQARALVESLLNGHLSTQVHEDQAHHTRIPTPYIPLRYSPATSVTAVTINGTAVLATLYSFTPLLLVREDGDNWPTGRVLVTYTTGWDEGYEPAEVQEAIALASAWFESNPGAGITSFREGNEAVTVTSDAEGPGVIRRLLRPWVRP